MAGVETFRAFGGLIDFAINSAVDDADPHQRYLERPAHQEGVALWREFATWVVAGHEF
ncbi:hypothetical protein ABT151_25740 [Streptomyces bluensis]